MRQECRHMNEVAGSRARCKFAIRAPAHFAYAGQHICDGLLLAMMVNTGASARLDLEHAAPHRRFDAELRRDGGQAFRARRLKCAPVEFTGVNDTNYRRIAHRFTRWCYRSKARDPTAAPRTNLAAQSAIIYPTLVLVRRALVGLTQTLVCAKRLDSPGG